MKLSLPVEIVGMGAAMPENVVTNADFEARLDTTDAWIVQRTGIRERRWTAAGESTLSLAVQASREALADAGLAAEDIDLIIVATITPEHTLPSTACELQAALGCRWIPVYDLVAACSGFVYAFTQGAQNVCNGLAGNALIVGAEAMTRLFDPDDRGTAILFGDAAAAVVIRRSEDPDRGIVAARLGADGSRARTIYIPAGGAALPASNNTVNEKLHFVRMEGRDVYKFAVNQMCAIVQETLDDVGMSVDRLKLLVPHQSNLRIIESAVKRIGIDPAKVVMNIDRYGNTSAASVPVALYEARRDGRYGPGDDVMMVAFGAGLTWGSALMRM
jgi:3-oxoacyl-[acyl-carrier-protein] synthase-3